MRAEGDAALGADESLAMVDVMARMLTIQMRVRWSRDARRLRPPGPE